MTSTDDLNMKDDSSQTGSNTADIAALKKNIEPVDVNPCHNGEITANVTGTEEAEGASCSAGTADTKTDSSEMRSQPTEQMYHVKWIQWKGNSTPIITQNENGPCPLIAIMNVLLLRGTVQIPHMVEMVSSNQLVSYLGDCLLNRSLENASEGVQRNYEQNIHDAMEIITKLSTGLDVNVKFTGIKDFEYTQECVVFDLLNISLCHGWLYDPQNSEIVSAVGTYSYNQVVEKIIASKTSKDENELHQGLVAEQFLENTAAQLTFYGLCELIAATEEGELCVFFRNNHFSTLIKHKNELCVLVTDQGFLTESTIVWETLGSVEGDSGFVDGEFNARPPTNQTAAPVASNMSPEQQFENDYLVALTLQQDQEQLSQGDKLQNQEVNSQATAALSDHELALQLQEQEDLRLAQNLAQEDQQAPPPGAQAAAPPTPNPTQAANQKEKSCTIL